MSIRVRGLSFIVRGRTILNDVAFDAAPGEVVAFVGPSGAGKTSLLRILAGLALPSAGEICVLGADPKHQRIGPARADIAMVHQHLALVGRSTVAENIVCGALGKNRSLLSLLGFFPLHLRQRACSMARLAGLEPSLMSRRVETLSGGQKQRVAIARALMPRPQVLLADEPTASLDPESASAIAAALARYAHEQQAVVCFSMHHLELATSIADRLIALRRGHVVFDGNPRAFGAATREAVFGEGAP